MDGLVAVFILGAFGGTLLYALHLNSSDSEVSVLRLLTRFVRRVLGEEPPQVQDDGRQQITDREKVTLREMFTELRQHQQPESAPELNAYIELLDGGYTPSAADARRWSQLLGDIQRDQFPAGEPGDRMFEQCCTAVLRLRELAASPAQEQSVRPAQ
jgi:hypothetical protein